MKKFFKNSWEDFKIIKNQFKFNSLFNNPISNNLGILLLLSIVGFIGFKTYKLSNEYFVENEISNRISSKFNTNDSITISNQNEVFEIISIHDTINKKDNNILVNKKGDILINDNIQSIKYEIKKSEKDSFELGDIGDFIGGYFGFWLGIIGALLTFLAFYIQYKANKDVQKQFRLQQFETQFHKMIDVYLNNKDKFSIVGYKNPKNKKVIVRGYNLEEKCNFENTSIFRYLNLNSRFEFIEYVTRDHIVFQKFLVELKVVYRVLLESFKEINNKNEETLTENDKKTILKEAYKLFIEGLNKYKQNNHHPNYIEKGIKCLISIRNKHRKDGSKKFEDFYTGKGGENKTLWVKLNYEPFKGYLHFLPQYYRNIYSIVKFVVNQNQDINLSQEQKEDYLKILRSTMSEYEQALLFYNWYSGMGSSWEDNENKFFTKYKMIHNMKKITLIDKELDIYNILQIPVNEQNDFFENF